jgi:hypothetical protein
VIAHIERTNPHAGTARDAWLAVSADMRHADWILGDLILATVPVLHPASKRDVKRYATFRGAFPAVVVTVNKDGSVSVADGAHRVSAARLRGNDTMPAYIGMRR